MKPISCKMKPYIQPFERDLALRELSALCERLNTSIECKGGDLFVLSAANQTQVNTLAEKLAYWESIEGEFGKLTSAQSLREATVNLVRNGIDLTDLKAALPFQGEEALPNRRVLRYGTHGIHEYRGKFFPQLVRSLINVADVREGGLVADPMSGSGTTIVEAKLAGFKALGLDMNPLSSMLTDTKANLVSANPSELATAYQMVRKALLAPEKRGQSLSYFETLPEADQKYLRSWFAEDVLLSLDEIMRTISSVEYLPAKQLMRVSFSNILRTVSWQKVEDLRVRKDIRLDIEIDPKHEFLGELGKSVRVVLAFLYQEGKKDYFQHRVSLGDARTCAKNWSDVGSEIDVIVTSPPYATALPYLDTDRLSLSYMGLLPRPEHRQRDILMIGNREVSEKQRRQYIERFEAEKKQLPNDVAELIMKIDDLNKGTDVGFRRKNLPALLFKYFSDMSEVISSMLESLREGGQAFVVVGNNHTIAGGQRVEIETAKLLVKIAEMQGFEVKPSVDMDMLASRDIFRKNAMATEEILYLRKPA